MVRRREARRRSALAKLRRRWEPARVPPEEMFTAQERNVFWEHVVQTAHDASAQIRSHAATSPAAAADAARAAADIMHAAALGSRILGQAAGSYDRPARGPYGQLPGPTPTGNYLRRAARLLAASATVSSKNTLAMVTLVTRLAALAEAVAHLRDVSAARRPGRQRSLRGRMPARSPSRVRHLAADRTYPCPHARGAEPPRIRSPPGPPQKDPAVPELRTTARQIQDRPRQRCACAAEHGGRGRYVFLGRDGGHPGAATTPGASSARPATAGITPGTGQPARLVIADAAAWPGVPMATWPSAQPGATGFAPRGRGVEKIPEDVPLACWLPIKFGLTPHGLRHSHRTWMAEDAIPEIRAEQRLGHEVPGMRGLYAHASDRMREDLKRALQARWEDSLSARAAIHGHSPVPLLDEILAPFRERARPESEPAAPRETDRQPTTLGDREKMISQITPNYAKLC